MSGRLLIGICVLCIVAATPATAATINTVTNLPGARFVPAPIGSPVSTVVEIHNLGPPDLVVSSVRMVGDPRFTVTTPSQPFSVGGGTFVNVTVTFTAQANSGLLTANLIIETNDAANPVLSLPFEGCAGPPVVGFDPPSYDFGVIAASSELIPFEVVNAGCEDLSVSGLTSTGPMHVWQSVSGVLRAGEGLPFKVSFRPAGALGPLTGSVSAASNAPGPSATLALSGTGAHGFLTPNFLELDFFSQVGRPATQRPVRLRNDSAYNVDVYSVQFSNPALSLPSGTMPPFSVSQGAEATVAITCTPTQLGPNNGTVTFVTSGQPAVITVTCTGAPTFYVFGTSYDFGPVPVDARASRGLTIANHGLQPITITSVSITGPAAADFMIEPMFAQPPILAAGTFRHSFTGLQFMPSDVGPRSATLTFETDDPTTPIVTIALSGSGYTADLILDVERVDFGEVIVGLTRTATINARNQGPTDMNASFALSGPDAASFGVGPTVIIPAGQSRPVELTFAPFAFQTVDAELTFMPSSQPTSITLSGTGLLADLELSPKPIDFGTWAVGESTQPTPVTLANHSAEAVVIGRIAATDPAYVIAGGAPATLQSGESLTFTVAFSPTVGGDHRAELRIYVGESDVPADRAALVAHALDESNSCGGCDAGASPTLLCAVLFGVDAWRRRRRRV